MTIYVCENCVDGIFTGVYDAWASRLGHANVALRVEGPADMELFAEYIDVQTDGEKAQKVADAVRSRMGMESYEMIYRAALANAPERADCIYRVLTVGLSRHTDSWTAHHLLEKLQDKNACRIFELSRKVWHEAHRYEGFVRFRELEGGVLFSEIEAENQVLPLIGEHFSDRFPNENFLIYDHHSRDCLVHAAGQQWFLWRGAGWEMATKEDQYERDGRLSEENPSGREKMQNSGRMFADSRVLEYGEENCPEKEVPENREGRSEQALFREQEIQRLWRGFCGSIAIHERENPHLQMQFWPLKFRKWMTEGR